MSEDLEEKVETTSEKIDKADELIELKKKVESQKVEIEDKDDRLKRLMAEFDNFKKRSAKEREGLYNSLISDIAISLLPVIIINLIPELTAYSIILCLSPTTKTVLLLRSICIWNVLLL